SPPRFPTTPAAERAMWPEQPETDDLLDRARRGEPGAVERHLAAHREPLRRVIGLRVDPALAARLDASDVVHDLLREAHRRLAHYRHTPPMPFRLWRRHTPRARVLAPPRPPRRALRRSLDREQPLVPRALPDQSSFELAGQLLDPELTPASAAVRRE